MVLMEGNMSEHTPEPWFRPNGTNRIYTHPAGGDCVPLDDDANLDRIVSCVNACAGIEDPAKLKQALLWLVRGDDRFPDVASVLTEIDRRMSGGGKGIQWL